MEAAVISAFEVPLSQPVAGMNKHATTVQVMAFLNKARRMPTNTLLLAYKPSKKTNSQVSTQAGAYKNMAASHLAAQE